MLKKNPRNHLFRYSINDLLESSRSGSCWTYLGYFNKSINRYINVLQLELITVEYLFLFPDIYWAMEPYKKDLFWHLREIRHSKRSVNKPSAAMPDVDVLDPSLLTQKCSPSELDELRILEICVNPLLTSNHKHFPYCK